MNGLEIAGIVLAGIAAYLAVAMLAALPVIVAFSIAEDIRRKRENGNPVTPDDLTRWRLRAQRNNCGEIIGALMWPIAFAVLAAALGIHWLWKQGCTVRLQSHAEKEIMAAHEKQLKKAALEKAEKEHQEAMLKQQEAQA